eukprot:s3853_g4.t1
MKLRKRFSQLLAGASWMGEYGDPSTSDWDEFLHQFSPYHLLKEESTYPAALFMTSTKDDRVHPGHARKMVAKLLEHPTAKDNTFYYENIEGGHGGAADNKQRAFMQVHCFIRNNHFGGLGAVFAAFLFSSEMAANGGAAVGAGASDVGAVMQVLTQMMGEQRQQFEQLGVLQQAVGPTAQGVGVTQQITEAVVGGVVQQVQTAMVQRQQGSLDQMQRTNDQVVQMAQVIQDMQQRMHQMRLERAAATPVAQQPAQGSVIAHGGGLNPFSPLESPTARQQPGAIPGAAPGMASGIPQHSGAGFAGYGQPTSAVDPAYCICHSTRIRAAMCETDAGRKKVELMEKRAEDFILKFKEKQDREAAEKRSAEEDLGNPKSKSNRTEDVEFVELVASPDLSGQEGTMKPALREADFVAADSQVRDEFIEEQRLKMQLGQVSLHEAYGIDPMSHVQETWHCGGCPPCGPYSQLQKLNQDKVGAVVMAEKRREAREHLEFCCSLYKRQAERGKIFTHEHPHVAESWEEECIEEVAQLPGVQHVKGDMCQQGMVGQDEHGQGAVRKPTGYLVNSECIAKEMAAVCKNRPTWRVESLEANVFAVAQTQLTKKGGSEMSQIVRRVTIDVETREVIQDFRDFHKATRSQLHMKFSGGRANVITIFYYETPESSWHRHVQLIGGKAKKAEVYPEGLLRSIMRGLRRELRRKRPLSSLELGPVNEEPYFDAEVMSSQDWSTFVDEVSGKPLQSSMVHAARQEELEYARRYDVWTVVPISEAWHNTWAGPIGSPWIDINKGDEQRPRYRSRLVIQEVRTNDIEAIFAATPPLDWCT